jgi:hypothetical protein
MRRVFLSLWMTAAGLVGLACGTILPSGDDPRGPDPAAAAASDGSALADGSASSDGAADNDAGPEPAGCGAKPKPFASAMTPTTVAADFTGVYWTSDVATGSVQGCPRGGCDGGRPSFSIPDQASPRGLALDSSDLFWTNAGDRSVNVARTTNSSDVTRLATRSSTPTTIVRAGTTRVYWLEPEDGEGKIIGCELDSERTSCINGGPTAFTTQNVNGGLASDGVQLYWTEESRIASCVLGTTCSAGADVVSSAAGTAIALAGSEVFYGANAGIWAAPKAGPGAGTPRPVAPSVDLPRAIAVSGTMVFWITDKAVFAGGGGLADALPLAALTAAHAGPAGIAVDASCVYWTDATGGSVMYVRRPMP